MTRSNAVYSVELAERAQKDLDVLDKSRIATKLKAIVAAAEYPVGMVAKIMGVATETIWRWAKAYEKSGLPGLIPKPKKPKPSKLTVEQKKVVLSWIDEAKTSGGKQVHWTLEKLRHSITEEFGVTLGINTIWVWLRKEGRRLKVPRPRHYKADQQAQEGFKKKQQNW